LLLFEKQAERLMKYIEKYLHVNKSEQYYTAFADDFPEKTLALFRRSIDHYAQTTGRGIYEHIVSLFKKMVKIKGGSEVVREMITQYRILYKNRKAMMEIINRF
jgi:CO dehydrogenase/acetyl-CoA synthase beta subunit